MRSALERALVSVVVGLAAGLGGPAMAQSRDLPTDEQVEKLVKDLQEAIFTYQVDHWLLQVKKTPTRYDQVTVTEDGYEVTGAGGAVTKLAKSDVTLVLPPGHFEPETFQLENWGGHTCMAVWALVASDVSEQDPRLQKALKAHFEGSVPRGTYSLSFRINTLSHLIQWRKPETTQNYKITLAREAEVMDKAMSESGEYGYISYPPPGFKEGKQPWTWDGKRNKSGHDNSNTQFGPFAMAAADDAGYEVDSAYWKKQDEWWQKAQKKDGRWAYYDDEDTHGMPSDVNMTDAGMNSLYIVLDKFYSRQTTGYRFLKGAQYTPQAQAGIQSALASINRGWKWIEGTGKGVDGKGGLYHEYGMQRLGLSSGRKRIGEGRPWYEKVVLEAYDGGATAAAGAAKGNQEEGGLRKEAWRLMCLAFGRQPVIFNKLALATPEEDWNYYFRDVANLTRWLSFRMERRHNWQIVSPKDSLHDLQDAPILIISSGKALAMGDAEKQTLKRFLDFGGTVFLNALHDSGEFKRTARKFFEDLYQDEGYEFRPLSRSHPIYTGKYGDKEPAATGGIASIPLHGMSDGARDFVILCEGDIAGAWHLRSYLKHEDVFKVMLNLRMYAAPSYFELPGRLRPKVDYAAKGSNKVLVARLKHSGNSKANRALYEALGPALAEQDLGVDLKDQAEPTDDGLAGAKLIHLTGHNRFEFKPEEVAAIKKALANGAFLVVDPAAGKPVFYVSTQDFLKQLGVQVQPIDPKTHPLFEGVSSLRPNRQMVTMVRLPGLFNELTLDGKVVGFLSKVDITAAATGCFVADKPGMGTLSARPLWVNLVKRAASGTVTTVATVQDLKAAAEGTTTTAPAGESN